MIVTFEQLKNYRKKVAMVDGAFDPTAPHQNVLLDVRVHRSNPPIGVDGQTGWPCFR